MHPPDPDDASREPATSPMICSNRKIAAKKMVVGEATASPRARCSPGRPAVRSLLAAMVSPTALPLLITILASSSLGPSYGAPQYIRDIVAQEEEYLRNRHHQHHRKKRHHQHHLRHNHQHLSNKRQKREQATPPIANRIESRVTYAGSAPPGWDPKIPRQSSNSKNKLIDPPVPIPDPYGWLRDDDRSNETVLQYLKAENAYTASVTDHLKSLQDEIYNEMLSSLKETDYSMPRPWGKYWYYSRTYEGSSYGAFCRAPIANWEESGGATIEARGSKSSSGGRSSDQHPTIDWDGSKDSPILPGEEVYLDVNDLAKGKAYCDVGSVSTSPSHDYVAYTVDYTGGEKRELHVRDLRTGRDVALLKSRKRSGIAKIETIAVADATAGSSGSTSEHLQENDELLTIDGFEWGKDDNTLYYTTTDDSQRAYRLYVRYNWKSESNFTDEQLKEENDVLFSVSVGKSFDERYLFYSSSSEETSEVWYLNLTSPKGFECVAPRRENVIYDVESHVDRSHGDRWYITTNVGGHHSDNFKLMSSPATYNCSDQWTLVLDDKGTTLFDGDPNTTRSIDGITAFSTHAIIEGREDGIPQLWMYSFANNALVRLDFEDDAYDVGLATNYEVGATRVALFYTSMIDPGSTIEVSFDDGGRQRTILKMDEVPGYDRELYGTERVHVPSRDGKTNIPVSLVYLKEAKEKAKAEAKGVEDDESGGPRVHLYGYGAYGMAMEADFSSSVLPLLKRGIIYAIAHVRGGGEMGRKWYEDGKLLHKKNSIYDFVDVARFLADTYTSPNGGMLSCEGASAGGLLVGASINEDPELFRVAILGHPFVDVAVTMTDASLPLTSGEWIEWGCPNEEVFFEYMLSYSPNNNIKAGVQYPAMWITGGLHDPRVGYWEPTKLAATLRHSNPSGKYPVCLKVDLDEGHFSASDRYENLRELSSDYAFLLDQLGLADN